MQLRAKNIKTINYNVWHYITFKAGQNQDGSEFRTIQHPWRPRNFSVFSRQNSGLSRGHIIK